MTSLKAHVMRHLFVLALLPRVFPATTPTTSDTPINTCCPPGHFLAIEDLQQSKQDPEGVWTPDHSNNEHPWHEAWRRHEEMTKASQKTLFTESYMAHKWFELLGLYGMHRYRWVQRLDRHQYISRVFCVPDQNDLPSIDGLSGSSLPSPPYYATAQDSILIENRVLAENQVLRSKGLKATRETSFHVQLFCSRLPSPFLPWRTSRAGYHCTWKRWVCRSQPYSTYVQVNRVALHGGMAIPLLSCGSMRQDCWLDGIWT